MTTSEGAGGLLPGDLDTIAKALHDRVAAAGPRGKTTRDLIGAVAAAEDVARRALRELAARGEAVERNGRWVLPEAAGFRVGLLRALPRGDATVTTVAGPSTTFLVEAKGLHGAIDGDRVLVRPLGRRSGAGGRRRGVVVRVLERRRATLVGTLERDGRGRWWLAPFDPKLSLEVEVARPPADAAVGDFVVVELERPKGVAAAVGRVVEVLGALDEPGTDVLAILRHYRIPDEFPEEVLTAAEALPTDPQARDLDAREDLRSAVTVTIDGATARDFDDAISVEPLGNRGWRVGVHIADVSHYVPEGGALDAEAYRRGNSVYYPDRAVPMLPERLSNGLCSLRPEVDRLTVSAFLELDREGRIRSRRFARTVIRSRRRLTYDEVRRVLEEPAESDRGSYGEVLDLLTEAREVMRALHRVREARGSLDFDLPEGDVVLDTDGIVVGVRPSTRHVAHRIIEEMMIAANEAVAEELESAGRGALHRVHHAPDEEDLEELREILRPLGIDLPRQADEIGPKHLQEVLEAVAGHPEEPFVSAVVLRAQQRAVYSPDPAGHYALATPHYLHFTSPIRRYPDLVVHRQLAALLAASGGGPGRERLEAMARHTSHTERRAEHSERELLQWKKVRYLADRVGERFTGRITGVQPFGVFVQLTETFVDGLVPVATLGDDTYRHDPETHQLIGIASGRSFRLAQEVEVELVGVDLRHRGLDLRLVGSGRAAPRRRRGRTGRRRERSRR